MAFFTIIVPVYNTQEYISRCLDSCIQQTFFDIEIIVIDDCGEDLAIDIAQKYAQQDKRIKIIKNSQNQGLFHTRIIGENEAKGEYIIHLDSDDFIHKDLCNKIFQHISIARNNMGGGDIDILSFGSQITPKPKHLGTFFITPYLKNQIDSVMELFSCNWHLCSKAYSKKILQKTNTYIKTHLSNIQKINMAEDILKFYIIAMFAKNHSYIGEYLHFYFQNPHSITKNTSYQQALNNIDDYTSVIKALEEIDLIHLSLPKDFQNLREQLINHCRMMIAEYSILSVKESYKNGFFCYCSNFIKSLKYIKGKRKIIYTIKFFLTFFTFGALKM